MPTLLKRSQVTHTPRVTRLLAEGERRFPGLAPSETLVLLAERGAAATRPKGVEGLIVLAPIGHTLTTAAVDEALLDD